MSSGLLALGLLLLCLAALLEWRRRPWRRRLASLQQTEQSAEVTLLARRDGRQRLQRLGLLPVPAVWQQCQRAWWLAQLVLLAGALCLSLWRQQLGFMWAWLPLALLLSWGLFAYYQRRWLAQCERQLPQALEQLARATAAGLGLQQALLHINEELAAPLQQEFTWLLQRLRIGDPVEQVLEQAGERLPLRSYRFFCLALTLNMETGGRLSQVLASQSQQLKQQRQSQQKLNTLTSEPRMAANVVAAIPLLMFIGLFWLSPRHVQFLLHDDTGRSMLAYAAISIGAGLASIRLLLMRAGG
ncbi:hypothetical protein GCM10011297_19630 [Bacterioplanes sanyensis]|uniref:type II secretion system F family protein n=1 Tax=Bacterioplanes sanyensis TaxID=1249553 RepID=UPI0016792024|nr:type II secretion system F family protein [Bacterioplanes sanyensis]GGY46826.1 hypothetical protein GCM10011297_19630 [Bacterioplanes sanyensis]